MASIHKLAEDLIRVAAHDADASVNKVEEDEEGWDALVSFPTPDSDLPPDLRPIGQTCLVQVKSRIGAKRTCHLKLSNALKFSRNPLPCFVVLLQFKPGEKRPNRIYLRHFWREEIAASLAVARRKHAAGKKALNQVNLPISFTKAKPTSLDTVMSEICGAVASVKGSYAAEKLKYADEVGYREEGRAVASFDHELTDEDFIDFLIGLRQEFPIKNMSVLETRFGITLPHPKFPPSASGKLELVDLKPNRSCSVVMRDAHSSESVTLAGDAYVPAIKDLPPELRKIRVVAPPLELVMIPELGKQTINASHDPQEKLSLERIRDVAGILSWLSSGTAEIEMFVGGLHLMNGVVTIEPNAGGPLWRRLYFVTKALIAAVPPERRPPSFTCSVVDLLDGMDVVAKFAGYSTESVTIRVPKPMSEMDGVKDFLGTYWLQMDDLIFYATVQAAITSMAAEGQLTAITMSKPEILRSGALPGPPQTVIPRVNAEAERLRAGRFEGGKGLMYLTAELDEEE